jgi:hypothetical protein
MPSGRLLQRWPAPSLTDGDRVWCMYAFVALVYGLLLPLLMLFIKEVHFRGKGCCWLLSWQLQLHLLWCWHVLCQCTLNCCRLDPLVSTFCEDYDLPCDSVFK